MRASLDVADWLTQPDEKTGRARRIASCSRRFNDTEMRSYSATEREAVAIKYCCEQFRYFILGEPGLAVYTDHKPLVEALVTPKTPRLRRLALQIDMYQAEHQVDPGQGERTGRCHQQVAHAAAATRRGR